MTTELRPGDPERLGPYRLLGRLGRGGMGTVFLAEDEPGHRVAIKVINANLSEDTAFRARFENEVNAARRVRRFCTAAVLDARLDGDPLYVVTQYIDGPTLERAVTASGPLPASDLEGLAVGVAAALTAVHGAGIVHRDLKPSNVLLSTVGPRVIDFGIARALDSASEATRSGHLVGTPGYLAPELLRGEEVTPACDVFSWGCIVAYAGTGEQAFPGTNISQVLYGVAHRPPELGPLGGELRELVAAALDKRPEARPSAQDLLTRLVGPEPDTGRLNETVRLTGPSTRTDMAGSAPPEDRTVPATRRMTDPAPTMTARPRRRRWPLVSALAAVVVAVVVGVLVTTVFRGNDNPDITPETPPDTLAAGHTLKPPNYLISDNGQYRLIQQGDGNLVLYNRQDDPLWESDTDHNPGAYTVLDEGGNLAVYLSGDKLWNSGTYGHPGADLTIQNDGGLVIYDKAGKPVWRAEHDD